MATPGTENTQQGDQPELACHRCGAVSEQRPLLPVVSQSTQQWVCVRCLPELIHGSH